jgi:SAM-dependent MidA family methyltransferase
VTRPPDARPRDDFALASSETPLAPIIRAEIDAAGGRIPFARFMALALGHPEHGYYSAGRLAWGRDGDYETSPEVHPVFGYLWARQVEQCWERLGRPGEFHLVEVGAGSGAFAIAILTWLRERAPDCFAATRPTLLDGSPRRLEAQRQALEARGLRAEHQLLDEWLGDDATPIVGVVIGNEFFDALPVHLVERRADGLHEWYVERDGDRFAFTLGEASTPDLDAYFARLGLAPGEECRAEVSLVAAALMRRIAARVRRGYIVAIDYGHEAADLYASWRRMGTLMAFRDHSPQPDPLAEPGRLDLTAHVDFTTLAAAAGELGFVAAPTVSQAEALTVLGLPEAMSAAAQRGHEDVGRYAEERRAAATLTNLEGLGRIRVLVLGRDAALAGLDCLRPIGEVYG